MDKLIPDLTAASLPLAGTELIELWQGGPESVMGPVSAIASYIGGSFLPYTGATANVDLNDKTLSKVSKLTIGSNSVMSSVNFRNEAEFTGATSVFANYSDGIVRSNVTTNAQYYTTSASTEASVFVLGSLTHFNASQSTFGAGSTIQQQIGYNVSPNLIGGTVNFGYRGQLPSTTGRWNLYMDGTAQNYLQGSTGIGISVPTEKLHVVGNGLYTLGTGTLRFQEWVTVPNTPAIYFNQGTPSSSNYVLAAGSSVTRLNGNPQISIGSNGTAVIDIASSLVMSTIDGLVWSTGTTTGLKIGSAITQKIGFFNATPIVQVGATVDLGVALSNLGLRAAGTAYTITTSGAISFGGTIGFTGASAITLGARNFVLDTTTGTKWGTATTQKQAWWNATPVVQQTTAIAAGAFVANTSGTLNDSATYGGYTIGQIAAALRLYGILA